MISVLVTGGLGFIGSHTVVNLLENNFKVIILDSNINSSYKVLNRIKDLSEKLKIKLINKLFFVKGDVRDSNLIERIFIDHKKIDAVIHYAGFKSVMNSFINPLDYWDNNVNGTLTILKVMDKNKCRNLVFSSSASIYDSRNKSPFKETSLIGPNSPYGSSKATVENLLKDLFESSSELWKIANLRYFNPIGAHAEGFLGDSPQGFSNNIFPSLLECAKKKDYIFKIYGNDWPTKDGTCIRDYIHVQDVAESHIKVLEKLLMLKERTFLNLNIGSGKGVSILELINTFQEVNNVKIKYKFAKRRRGDSPILVADNNLAFIEIKWRPKRDLEDMCRDGFNWFKSLNKVQK